MNKLYGEVVIELTRRCNMSCEHCLRGEPEDMDMASGYMATLLDKFDYITIVTFTGGEPSLRPHHINLFFSMAKEKGVGIGSFYIATNAMHHERSDEFMLACLNAFASCDDNEASRVEWSDDSFHDAMADEQTMKMLKAFSFSGHRGEIAGVIKEGRAQDWPEGRVNKYPDFAGCEDDGCMDGLIYLNCKGEIIDGCDYAYNTQHEHLICSVADLSVESLQAHEGEE